MEGPLGSDRRHGARRGRLSYWLVLLFLALLYSNAALLVPALEAVRPAQAVALLALVVLAVELVVAERAFRLVWPESYLLLGFVAAAALSVAGALWPGYAAEQLADLAKMAAVSLLVLNVATDLGRLRGIATVMVVGGLFPALGTLQHYATGQLVEGSRAGWIGIFENPNELAYSLVILLPLALYLARDGSLPRRAALYGVAAIYLPAIFVTFSRGGLLALAVVIGLSVLRSRKLSVWVLAVAGGIVCLAFADRLWTRDEGFSGLRADTTVQERLWTIRVGLEMFADRPLTGVGLGCSMLGWPLYAPADAPSNGWLHSHNTLVQALAETGLAGFVPFAGMLAAALVGTGRLARRGRAGGERAGLGGVGGVGGVGGGRNAHLIAPLAFALHASLWGFLACGLAGGFVLSWFPYLLIALVAATRAVSRQPQPEPAADRGVHE